MRREGQEKKRKRNRKHFLLQDLSNMASYERHRLRSRTPPARRCAARVRSGDCCICLEPLGNREVWRCLLCSVNAHVDCMPRNERGRIHLPNGCPQCRMRLVHAIAVCKTPIPAPRGTVCIVCRQLVNVDAPVHRCAQPRYGCIAHWHPTCSTAPKCPGCHLTVAEALGRRRL